MTDPDGVQAMVANTLARFGRIDILINNAGILRDRSFHKVQLDDVLAVIDVHLTGSLRCTHAVWPLMRDQGYGRILFTSSQNGTYGNFGQAGAERELQAAAQCRAVDRGDHRLVARLDPFDHLRQRRLGHRRAEFADVGAADEIAAGAGDDDGADRVGLGGMAGSPRTGRRAWRPRPR